MIRLFTALEIPDDVAAQLALAQSGLKDARWVPRENLHITLRFVGQVDEATAADVDAALTRLKAKPIEKIIFGHKIALKDLEADEKIIKYGQVIGVASRKIKVGEWVHTHNVNSARMNTEGEEMRGVT